jgi:KUP system potassium uptake protein
MACRRGADRPRRQPHVCRCGSVQAGHQEHLAGLAGEEVDGFVVFPACVLSYLGQGALVLDDPARNISSPFFLLVPQWGRLPMVLLATAATVIASQAVITNAFSVASQAAQLGYLPRLRIRHTSHETIGQIYVPWINWL